MIRLFDGVHTSASASLPPTPAPERAAAEPKDSFTIATPYSVGVCNQSSVSLPLQMAFPIDCPEMSSHDLTGFQRVVVAGLSGMAIFGTMLASGTMNARPPMNLDMSTISKTLQRGANSAPNVLRGNVSGALAAQATPAGSKQEARAQRAKDQEQPKQQNNDTTPPPPRRTRVFGQDVGGQLEEIPGVKWVTYAGTYNGNAFEIEHPEGWKVTKVFNGIAVINPKDTQTVVLFQWRSGQGNMTPSGLINTLLGEAQASNVKVNRATPTGPRNTPIGQLYSMESDISYTGDGNALRAEMTAAVANAPNSYIAFWNGNIVAAQSSQANFNQNIPILRHVANSMAGK